MFVELVDHLRCPQPHESTWLVLAAGETRDRHVIEGTLGCPVCGEQYPVVGGTAWFTQLPTSMRAHRGTATPLPGGDGGDWPLRLAAYLGLADGRGVVGLYGKWAAYAEALGDVVEGIEPLAVDPGEATHPLLSAVVPRSRAHIPLATGSLRAVALDPGEPAAQALTEAVRIVRDGGRILAPAAVPLPAGVRELARDTDWWVGEREAPAPGIVSIAGRKTVRGEG